MWIVGSSFFILTSPVMAQFSQACVEAQQVCTDAKKMQAQCVRKNGVLSVLLCNSVMDAQIAACKQADFTCSRDKQSSKPG